jgi:alpha-amylase
MSVTLITLFFFAHQPDRLLPYEQRRAGDRRSRSSLHARYFDDELNRQVFNKVADKCYRPATSLLLDLVRSNADREKPFRVAFGLSGTLIDQMERYGPDVLDIFRGLAETGLVEFTGETYYHSVSGLFDSDRVEFQEQARLHSDMIATRFGRRPTVFRNTE